MNGEDFRRDVSNLLTRQVALQEETNLKLEKLCGGFTKADHARVERKIEKIWDRVLIMGVVISAIAAALGVAGMVS